MGCCNLLPEFLQIHNVQGRDVVRSALQVIGPEALLPEPESVHVFVVVTERSVCQGSTLQM